MKNYKTPEWIMSILTYIVILTGFLGSLLWVNNNTSLYFSFIPTMILFIYVHGKGICKIYQCNNHD